MDIGNITALSLGLLAGVVVFAILFPLLNRRTKEHYEEELAKQERLIADLRQERSDDRETNRRLRRDLAIQTPQNFEVTREERDAALEELDRLGEELRGTNMQLANRDRSLREARLAIHDIRVQIERGRFADTSSLPAAEDDSQAGDLDDDPDPEAVGESQGDELPFEDPPAAELVTEPETAAPGTSASDVSGQVTSSGGGDDEGEDDLALADQTGLGAPTT